MVNISNESALSLQFQKKLKDSLRKIIKENDLTEQKQLIKQLATELNVDPQVFAAALICQVQQSDKESLNKSNACQENKQKIVTSELRMLWYRVEVGHEHQVAVAMLKNLLVDESGVEERLIGRVNIYDKHTLIQLPNGMPAELLRHLKTVAINKQPLDIKRLKNRPYRKSKRNKQKTSNNGISKKEADLHNTGDNLKFSSGSTSGSDERVTPHLLAKS